MTAIVTGSHSGIVDKIGKNVGIEEACKYRQRNPEVEHIPKVVVPVLPVFRKKREEKEFRFDDPNVDVLTYLKVRFFETFSGYGWCYRKSKKRKTRNVLRWSQWRRSR